MNLNRKLKLLILFHKLFDQLLPVNKKQAKVGDQILINYRNFRYPGRLATVIEEDRRYWEDINGVIKSEYSKGDITIIFTTGRKMYNLISKEYWIWNKCKIKIKI